MAKMAVIGDSTSVMGFKPLGVDTFPVVAPGDVVDLWPQIAAADYAIVMMTEPVFEAARSLLGEVESRVTPAVLAIPSAAGSTGAGRRYIKALVERAVGTTLK